MYKKLSISVLVAILATTAFVSAASAAQDSPPADGDPRQKAARYRSNHSDWQ